ncbi:DUF445 domain-containing protein [Capillibacterium thermochitinicola]|uniref:DUF445 family protein n=1 Tax=Capillibacterium thermochitinicola TaxID=2699427 RepID=A0A8J6LMH5_9FIRM|nr:DUF445 family protein [Capillibacterium thermochitinicola]MBA2132813.1 DUF445 family protein [Capillibacterium thermochitinicola]
MADSTEKSFVYKWLGKLKSDLGDRLLPERAGQNLGDQGAGQGKRPLSIRIAMVLNLLNYPLYWSGIVLCSWLLFEYLSAPFLPPTVRAQVQSCSQPLVAVCGPAAVGYWTNWLAIKMLFHPQRKNAVWWGLIHARREELILNLAAGIQSAMVSPEIIRNYLYEHGVLNKLTTAVAGALDGVFRDPQFQQELKEVVAELLARIGNDPRTEARLDQYLEQLIKEWSTESFSGKVLAWTKELWVKSLRKQVSGLLAQLPASSDYFTARLVAYLETIPVKLVAGEKVVEPLVADLIAEGVRGIDLEKVIRAQLQKMDPSALEHLLTANISAELVFIQTSGGIFGFLVGLAILYPFLRPVFLLAGLVLWVVYLRTVEKK